MFLWGNEAVGTVETATANSTTRLLGIKYVDQCLNAVAFSVASERNQHCGGEAMPKGPKLKARRAEPLPGPPGSGGAYQLGVCGSAASFPVGSGCQEFRCILGSSGELFCSAAMHNCVYRPPL